MTGPRSIGAQEALAIVQEVGETVAREKLPDLLADIKRLEARITIRLHTPDAPRETFVPPDEVAERLEVSRSTLYRMARTGDIPFAVRQTKGRVQFSRPAFERYLREIGGLS